MGLFEEFVGRQKGLDVVNFDELAKEDSYYVSSNLALNAIMSGDFEKGIPKKKPTFIVGESGSGKSYLTKCICSDAIDNHFTGDIKELTAEIIKNQAIALLEKQGVDITKVKGKAKETAIENVIPTIVVDRKELRKRIKAAKSPEKVQVVWWDVEDAYEDIEEVLSSGIPLANLNIPKYLKDSNGDNIIWSIETWHVSAKRWIDYVRKFQADFEKKYKKPCDYEFIFVLDSLGELPSLKEVKDVDRDDSVSDMGGRAKIWKARLRPLMGMMREIGITFIGINHVFDNPADTYAMLPEIPGGHYLKFVAQRILWVRAKNIKNEDKDKSIKKFNGINIVLFNYKNRKVQKGTYVEVTLTPKGGMHKYADILKLVPDMFKATDQKGLNVLHQWSMGKSDEQIRETIKDAVGLTEEQVVTIKPCVEYCITSTQKKFKDGLKDLFEYIEAGDEKGTMIIKVISKKYKKANLYNMGSKFFTDELIDEINTEIKGWMQLNQDFDDSKETEFDEDEEDAFEFEEEDEFDDMEEDAVYK